MTGWLVGHVSKREKLYTVPKLRMDTTEEDTPKKKTKITAIVIAVAAVVVRSTKTKLYDLHVMHCLLACWLVVSLFFLQRVGGQAAEFDPVQFKG